MSCGKLYTKAMGKVRKKHPSWGLKRRKKYAASIAYQKKGKRAAKYK